MCKQNAYSKGGDGGVVLSRLPHYFSSIQHSRHDGHQQQGYPGEASEAKKGHCQAKPDHQEEGHDPGILQVQSKEVFNSDLTLLWIGRRIFLVASIGIL
jgi:hypothetical protein